MKTITNYRHPHHFVKVGHPFLTWPCSIKTTTNYRHPHHFVKVGHPFLTWPCRAPCTPCWRAVCLGPGSDSRALRAGLVEYYCEWSTSSLKNIFVSILTKFLCQFYVKMPLQKLYFLKHGFAPPFLKTIKKNCIICREGHPYS